MALYSGLPVPVNIQPLLRKGSLAIRLYAELEICLWLHLWHANSVSHRRAVSVKNSKLWQSTG